MIAYLDNGARGSNVDKAGYKGLLTQPYSVDSRWNVLVVVAIVLLALWVLGLVFSWGGLIYILLVVALVIIIVRLLRGKKIL